MIESATGLVLRTRPLTDTSLVVHWLTPDHGRLATVAKGARRQKSPFAGKLDFLHLADFSFMRSRKSELHTLREVSLLHAHPVLRTDIERLQHAAHAVTLIEQVSETDTPLPQLFALLQDYIGVLARSGAVVENALAFELKLLREQGLQPDFSQPLLPPGELKIARHLLEDDWDVLSRLRLSDGQTGRMASFLHGYLLHHLGRVPRTRSAVMAH
jgi:DNA repair protein RecO (recombination protein O)